MAYEQILELKLNMDYLEKNAQDIQTILIDIIKETDGCLDVFVPILEIIESIKKFDTAEWKDMVKNAQDEADHMEDLTDAQSY